jgi:hypothetical protein
MGNIVDITAGLADLKTMCYRNTLALVSLIEVLIENGIIQKNDVALKALELDEEIQKNLKHLTKYKIRK